MKPALNDTNSSTLGRSGEAMPGGVAEGIPCPGQEQHREVSSQTTSGVQRLYRSLRLYDA